MGAMSVEVPSDVHPQVTMALLARKYDLGDFFYIDIYPISEPLLCVVDPGLLAQLAQCPLNKQLDKHATIRQFTQHVVGKMSMLLAEGEKWRSLRNLFSPGFSSGHLSTTVEGIVDEAVIFRNQIATYEKSREVCSMEYLATGVTIDIIGRVAMDQEFKSQTQSNELVEGFRSQSHWTPKSSDLNPFVNWNPVAPVMRWWYEQKMNNYLEKYIEDRYRSGNGNKTGKKNLVDLALDAYTEQNRDAKGVDKFFKRAVIDK
jgi:cytochrome P450